MIFKQKGTKSLYPNRLKSWHSEILPPLKERKFLSTIITIWRSLFQNGIETSTMKNSGNLQGVLFGMICDTAPATCCISLNCEDSIWFFVQTKNDKKKNVFSTFCHVTNNSAINNKEWICYSPMYSLIFSIWYCTFYICTNVKDTHVLFSKKRWFAVRLQICIPT